MRIHFLSLFLFLMQSCEYKDFAVTQVEPPCTSENSISFSKDVLPVFESKCSFSKCHSHDNNLIPYLTNWKEISSNKADIPFQLQNGAMPPYNSKGGQLSSHEIGLIVCWINQGALDN